MRRPRWLRVPDWLNPDTGGRRTRRHDALVIIACTVLGCGAGATLLALYGGRS